MYLNSQLKPGEFCRESEFLFKVSSNEGFAEFGFWELVEIVGV